MPLVRYQAGMQLGRGFSSVEQTLKKFGAVKVEGVNDPTRDSNPKPTQNVHYLLRLVNSVSEACDVLDISGAVAIRTASVQGQGGGGGYLDLNRIATSSISFFVRVIVENQYESDYTSSTTFQANPSEKLVKDVMETSTSKPYTSAWGDSFISRFHYGGEFDALVTIETKDEQTKNKIKADLEFSFKIIEGKGGFSKLQEILQAASNTDIQVMYSGADPQKMEVTRWDIETMIKKAAKFPTYIGTSPIIRMAEYESYDSLHDFPVAGLSFDYAKIVINQLADVYYAYNNLLNKVKAIGSSINSYFDSNGKPPDPDVIDKLLDDINTALFNVLVYVQHYTNDPRLKETPKIPHPSVIQRRVNVYVPINAVPGPPVSERLDNIQKRLDALEQTTNTFASKIVTDVVETKVIRIGHWIIQYESNVALCFRDSSSPTDKRVAMYNGTYYDIPR